MLVVSFDRWPWPALGCYGHEWIDTPAWDQLVADGFVFDRCVATIDPNRRAGAEPWNDLLPRLRVAGHKTTLFREVAAASLGPDALWDAAQVVVGNTAADAPLPEQPFAQTVQAAITKLQAKADNSRLIWVHGVGLPERCPVSRAALELYAADFAEEGLRIASMADEELVDHELTRATTLSVLDHWLGELLDAARSLPGRKLLMVFAWEGVIWEPAPRITPLIAPFDPQVAQVPWIIAGDDILPGRTNALVTTDDLFSTLAGWVGVRDNPENRTNTPVSGAARTSPQPPMNLLPLIAGDVPVVRSHVQHDDANGGALWTPDDLTLFARDGDDWTTQRYLWPEDGWAIHDISAQTPDVTSEHLSQFRNSRSKTPTE